MADNTTTVLNVNVNGQNQIDALANSFAKLGSTSNNLSQSLSQVAGAGGSLTIAINNITKASVGTVNNLNGMAQSVKSVAESSNKLSLSWGSIERIMIGSAVSRTIGMMIRGFEAGVTSATEFLVRIGEIQTISQQNQQSTGAWAQQVRGLSDAFGMPILKVAESQYQAISNQIAHGAQSTTFMNEAMRLAVITVSSADNAVQALTGVLNSYGLSANHARTVSDQLFKTIELGRLRLDQIATSIGTVTAVASELGVKMEEVFGGLVTLTRLGIQPAVVMTELRGIMMKLIKPTDEMKKLFREWGVESGEAAVKTFGFIGVFQKLIEAANEGKGIVDEMGKSFNNVRAIVGAVGLASNMNLLGESIRDITTGAKTADEALRIMQQNTGYQMRVEWEKTKNIFTIDFGTRLIDNFASLNKAVGGFSNILSNVLETALALGKGITLFYTGKFVVWLTTSTAEMVRLTAATLAAARAQTVLNMQQQAMLGMRGYAATAGAGASVASLINPILAGLAIGYVAMDAWLNRLSNRIKDFSNVRIAEHQRAAAEIIGFENKIAAETQDAFTRSFAQAQQVWSQAEATLRGAYNRLADLKKQQQDLDDILFDADMRNLDAAGKYNLVKQRMVEIERQLAEAVSKKAEPKAIKELFKELENAYGKAGDLKNLLVAINQIKTPDGVINISPPRYINAMRDLNSIYQRGIDLLRGYRKSQIDLTKTDLTPIDKNIGQLNSLNRAMASLIETSGRLTTQMAALRDAQGKATAEMEGAAEAMSQAAQNLAKPAIWTGFGPIDGPSAQALKNIAFEADNVTQKLKSLSEAGVAPTARQVGELKRDIDNLGKSYDATGIKNKDLEEQLKIMKRAVGELGAATRQYEPLRDMDKILKAKMEDIKTNTTAVTAELQGMLAPFQKGFDITAQTANQLLNTVDVTSGALMGLNGSLGITSGLLVPVENGFAGVKRSIEGARDAQLQLNEALRAMPARSNWSGGYAARRFASGGVASDTIPAYLAAGEVIMNKMAARQNMAQLIAMNAGTRNYNSGGNVTNNIGDINVTVQGGNSSERTVREIGEKLRREIRRGTVRL